jgi:hypothetical protein
MCIFTEPLFLLITVQILEMNNLDRRPNDAPEDLEMADNKVKKAYL